MKERTITCPCSPGDTLWAIIGDEVRQCKVEKLAVYISEEGCSIFLNIEFVAPNPFLRGQEKTYRDFAILGRRAAAYRAAYPSREAAEKALEEEGPDYKS